LLVLGLNQTAFSARRNNVLGPAACTHKTRGGCVELRAKSAMARSLTFGSRQLTPFAGEQTKSTPN
jgi:hypothetical protein